MFSPLYSGDPKHALASPLRGEKGLVGRSQQFHHWMGFCRLTQSGAEYNMHCGRQPADCTAERGAVKGHVTGQNSETERHMCW